MDVYEERGPEVSLFLLVKGRTKGSRGQLAQTGHFT